MSSRRAAVEFWDEEIGRWARGGRALHPDLERWLAGYSGKGAGAVDLEVIPEPYIGSLGESTPALVMLGLNPGAGAPGFQGPDGVYTRRIRETSYSAWAASGPYSDEAWESVHGRNRYQHARLAFARCLNNDTGIQATDLLFLELYPFHSQRVTAAMLPPHDLLSRFILKPLCCEGLGGGGAVGAVGSSTAGFSTPGPGGGEGGLVDGGLLGLGGLLRGRLLRGHAP